MIMKIMFNKVIHDINTNKVCKIKEKKQILLNVNPNSIKKMFNIKSCQQKNIILIFKYNHNTTQFNIEEKTNKKWISQKIILLK